MKMRFVYIRIAALDIIRFFFFLENFLSTEDHHLKSGRKS